MNSSPSRRDPVIAVSASIVFGMALWVTRASLDFIGTAGASERVAMLPAWSELLGLVVLAMLVTSAIASLLQRTGAEPGRARFWSPVVSDTLLPLFGLSFLVLPYLPFLADWIPALRIFAGPARGVVWGIVLGQVLWILAPRLVGHRRGPAGAGAQLLLATAIGATTLALSAIALPRLMLSEHFSASPAAPTGATSTVLWISMLLGAGVAAMIWLWARAEVGSASAASVAWAAVCLSPPFALNTLAVYPEGPLAFGVVGATVLAWRLRRRLTSMALYSLAVAVSLAAWIFVTRGDTSLLDPGAVPVGVAGLLFDQEYGVVAYAPALLLGIVGLAAMARDHATRKTAWLLALVVVPFTTLAACIDPWWSKSAMPGRLILPVFPLLGVPVAWCYRMTAERPAGRAAVQLLVLGGMMLTAAISIAGENVPLPQEADGSSSLLQWMSHGWQLWSAAPSFVVAEPGAAARLSLWLGAFVLFGWLCRGGAPQPAGRAALRVGVYAAVIWLATVSLSAAVPVSGGPQRFDPEARAALPMLETFDSVARPIAVRYNPLTFVAPQSLPPLFSLAAAAGERRERQPVRVVLNARFRLPAGEYAVDLLGSKLAGTVETPTIGLQLGREGIPVEVWPVSLSPGAHSQHRFHVPLDSQFVGFRASRQMDATIASMRLRPVNVVETRRRFHTPLVRAAAAFGPAIVFFHDGRSYVEPDGFWVKGRSVAHMTLAKRVPSNPSVTLALHSGAQLNVVTLSTGRWSERVELVPGVTVRVEVPSDATEQFIPLTIATTAGFVPAEVERKSRDRRFLGVWISLIPDDTARTSGAP